MCLTLFFISIHCFKIINHACTHTSLTMFYSNTKISFISLFWPLDGSAVKENKPTAVKLIKILFQCWGWMQESYSYSLGYFNMLGINELLECQMSMVWFHKLPWGLILHINLHVTYSKTLTEEHHWILSALWTPLHISQCGLLTHLWVKRCFKDICISADEGHGFV